MVVCIFEHIEDIAFELHPALAAHALINVDVLKEDEMLGAAPVELAVGSLTDREGGREQEDCDHGGSEPVQGGSPSNNCVYTRSPMSSG